MFTLGYTVTAADMRAENKRLALFYATLYMAIAAVGIAVGIVSTVIRADTFMLVLGIVLTALGAILMLCAILLLAAPKTMLASAVPTDTPLEVVIDKNGITANGETVCAFADISRIKIRKTHLALTVGKDLIVIIKDAIASGGTFNELREYMSERAGKMLLSVPEQGATYSSEQATDISPAEQTEKAPDSEAQAESGEGEARTEPSAPDGSDSVEAGE